MYAIYGNIYHQYTPNVGIYIYIPYMHMDPMDNSNFILIHGLYKATYTSPGGAHIVVVFINRKLSKSGSREGVVFKTVIFLESYRGGQWLDEEATYLW